MRGCSRVGGYQFGSGGTKLMKWAFDRSISLCLIQMVSPRLPVYENSLDSPITSPSFCRLDF
jgi:hypothetical protein